MAVGKAIAQSCTSGPPMYLKLRAHARAHTYVYYVTHVRRMTRRKKSLTLDWVWANRGSRVPPSLRRLRPDVSSLRVTRVSDQTRASLLFSSFPPFFSVWCPSVPLPSGYPAAVSKFSLLHTSVSSGDPVRFLPSPASLFPRPTSLRVSRNPPIFPLCYRTYRSAVLVFILRSRFIFSLPLSLVRSFSSFWFCTFLCLIPIFLDLLSFIYFFFPSTFSVASFTTLLLPLAILPLPSPSSFPLSILSFYFYLSFASFRILRIRFSARTLYVSRSFSRIIPALLFLHFVFILLFFPPATSSNSSHCFAVLDLLWSLIKKNNRKDVIGTAGEVEH